MTNEELIKIFNEFLINYNEEKYRHIWVEQSKTFREFWQTKILKYKGVSLPEADYDSIIRLIDVKARGFNRETDEAVAHVGITQGTWYRIFNDLKDKDDIKKTLDKIFNSGEETVLIEMVNRLEKENDKNKNGLTGKQASALNALLFINKPNTFLSSVSLSHRFQILKAFDFGQPEIYKTYGEKVIKSNNDILSGFKEKLGITAQPRTLSSFLYSQPIKSFWQKSIDEKEVIDEEEASISKSEFIIEKHLEDFLVGNWESTELGKLYDLIEENDEMVSQQYHTDIGSIDLLVKDKKNGDYVVIELKKGQSNDDTIGQLARYMGWIKQHKSNGRKVRGIIIASNYDPRLKYALDMVPDSEFYLYRINFFLKKPPEEKGKNL